MFDTVFSFALMLASAAPSSRAAPCRGDEIFALIYQNDLQGLRELLTRHPHEIRAQEEGTTMSPLCTAACDGSIAAVDVLLEFGADIEEPSQGQTPLMWAAQRASPSLAQHLLERGAEVNRVEGEWTALRYSACRGNTDVVRLLLTAGADPKLPEDPEATSILNLAAERSDAALLDLLLAAGAPFDAADPRTGNTPLHVAALDGNEAALRALLKRGAKPNVKGELDRSPLHLACSSGHASIVKVLLDAGSEPGATDRLGATPMHVAAQEGYDQIVATLEFGDQPLEAVNATDRRGWTPLHEAAAFGNHRCLWELSVVRPAKLDARTGFGRTALHLAALRGDVDAVALLLDRGADPSLRDARGRSALEYVTNAVPPALLRRLGRASGDDPSARPIALPDWDGKDPAVSVYLHTGYTVRMVSGVLLAAWSDGVVVFAADPSEPESTLRVGAVPAEDVALALRELADAGYFAFPSTENVGMHSPSVTIAAVGDGGRHRHEWDRDLHPRGGFHDPSSVERSFARMWSLAESALDALRPTVHSPLAEHLDGGAFRGYDAATPAPPSWAR